MSQEHTIWSKCGEFERGISLRPGFDKRHSDPKKNYGIHGADLTFYLRGEKGVIQFMVYTHWMIPSVQAEIDAKPPHPQFPYMSHKPMAADIGYHSPVPMYEGQSPMEGECPVLGCQCYYDGSGLRAEEKFWPILVTEGLDGLFGALEAEYRNRFTT